MEAGSLAIAIRGEALMGARKGDPCGGGQKEVG